MVHGQQALRMGDHFRSRCQKRSDRKSLRQLDAQLVDAHHLLAHLPRQPDGDLLRRCGNRQFEPSDPPPGQGCDPHSVANAAARNRPRPSPSVDSACAGVTEVGSASVSSTGSRSPVPRAHTTHAAFVCGPSSRPVPQPAVLSRRAWAAACCCRSRTTGRPAVRGPTGGIDSSSSVSMTAATWTAAESCRARCWTMVFSTTSATFDQMCHRSTTRIASGAQTRPTSASSTCSLRPSGFGTGGHRPDRSVSPRDLRAPSVDQYLRRPCRTVTRRPARRTSPSDRHVHGNGTVAAETRSAPDAHRPHGRRADVHTRCEPGKPASRTPDSQPAPHPSESERSPTRRRTRRFRPLHRPPGGITGPGETAHGPSTPVQMLLAPPASAASPCGRGSGYWSGTALRWSTMVGVSAAEMTCMSLPRASPACWTLCRRRSSADTPMKCPPL